MFALVMVLLEVWEVDCDASLLLPMTICAATPDGGFLDTVLEA